MQDTRSACGFALTCAVLVIAGSGAPASVGPTAGIPNAFLQAELVAELNGMVDKYRKLITTGLSQNWKELKVRKVTLVSADEEFMYVKLSVRIREINGLTDLVLYTLDGTARGKFSWGTIAADRLCVAASLGQSSPLMVTETRNIPKIDTPELARAAEMAIKANFQREVCAPMWPSIRVAGSVAPEKTKGGYRRPSRPNKLVFTVALSNLSARNVKVKYATADDTAKAGIDYEAASGELLIPDGTRSKDIQVDIIPRDGSQGGRRMRLRLWSPINGKISDNEAIGVIIDAGQTAPSGAIPVNPL